ncbi:MAG: molybdenum cofactor biosynthesis protein MoaE [Alphaproteobacteria bacterium]
MIRVQTEDFDVAQELARVRRGDHGIGGIALFVGVVRAGAGDETIRAMTLEHYPAMTERELAKIEAEAKARWPLEAVTIIHRYGRLEPGDQIVLVIAASSHRQAAFEACEFLVDWLKTKAPFWKLEDTSSGSHWVEARAADDDAAERWQKESGS